MRRTNPAAWSSIPLPSFHRSGRLCVTGLSKGIAVRFMDLPVAVQFGLDREREERLAALNEENREEKGEEESEDDVSSGVSDPDSAAEASEAEAGEESCGESDGEPEEAGDEDFDYADPLDWLGRAAGYENGESWWNHMGGRAGGRSGAFRGHTGSHDHHPQGGSGTQAHAG